jgi:NADH-quinone oxidoreductase subunit E
MKNIYESIDAYLLLKNGSADIFDILHFVQSKMGCIPEEVQRYIAEKISLEFLEIKEIIEISSFFLEKKEGINVTVCSGPGCTMKGSMEILEEISKKLGINVNEQNKEVFLTVKNCFKSCSYGVNVEVNGKLMHNITLSTLDKILEKIKFY